MMSPLFFFFVMWLHKLVLDLHRRAHHQLRARGERETTTAGLMGSQESRGYLQDGTDGLFNHKDGFIMMPVHLFTFLCTIFVFFHVPHPKRE